MVAEMPFCLVGFCCIHVSPIHKIHFTRAQWGQILSRRTSQPADLPSRGRWQSWLFSNAGSNPLQMRTRGPRGGGRHLPKDKPGLKANFPDSKPKAISALPPHGSGSYHTC